jgi:hypothetical protein
MFIAPVEPQSTRAVPRSHVLMRATLLTHEGAVSVRIRDVSVRGAQIWTDTPVPSDCDAILKRGDFFAAVRVLRCSGHHAGLQFYRQLSRDEFEAAFKSRAALAELA